MPAVAFASYETYKAAVLHDEMRIARVWRAKAVLKILPLLLVPAFVGGVVYWLTRRPGVSVAAGAVILGAMLFIGVTS